MKLPPSLMLLLGLLLLLSLGSDGVFVGCGSGGVSGGGSFACFRSTDGDDPCDSIVTVEATVLLAADDSPVPGATVTIDTGPPDAVNTRVTDLTGTARWEDTSFITGFSAQCGGRDVGTVEPYDADTSFSYDVLVSAPGLAPSTTVLTVTRRSRELSLLFRLLPP